MCFTGPVAARGRRRPQPARRVPALSCLHFFPRIIRSQVRLLLEAGADPNQRDACPPCWSPAEHAASGDWPARPFVFTRVVSFFLPPLFARPAGPPPSTRHLATGRCDPSSSLESFRFFFLTLFARLAGPPSNTRQRVARPFLFFSCALQKDILPQSRYARLKKL